MSNPPTLCSTDARNVYATWAKPTVIIADGDQHIPNRYALEPFFRSHVRDWTEAAENVTTLWLWSSEPAWMVVHAMLVGEYGWTYKGTIVWDKGTAAASTSQTKSFPVSTECCMQYVRSPVHAKFNLRNPLTNVWRDPPMKAAPRFKLRHKLARHMDLLIQTTSDPGDVVWEPFGGLADVTASAYALGRNAYYAESSSALYDGAVARIHEMSAAEEQKRAMQSLYDEAMDDD
jgi:hypothetical protein